jgi:hypothetical protein
VSGFNSLSHSQLLTLFSSGNNVTFGVSRLQTHSMIPSGNFLLSFPWENKVLSKNIPISADADTFRSLMGTLSHTHVCGSFTACHFFS